MGFVRRHGVGVEPADRCGRRLAVREWASEFRFPELGTRGLHRNGCTTVLGIRRGPKRFQPRAACTRVLLHRIVHVVKHKTQAR